METEKEALAFLYASGNRRRPSEPSGPLIMSKGNKVKYLLNLMAPYRIKDNCCQVFFWVPNLLYMMYIKFLQTLSFPALIVNGWENEENLTIHFFQEGINM